MKKKTLQLLDEEKAKRRRAIAHLLEVVSQDVRCKRHGPDGGDTVEGRSVEGRIAEGLRLIDLGHPAVWRPGPPPLPPVFTHRTIDAIPKIKAHKGKKVARVTYGTANGQTKGDSGTC